MTKKLYDIDSHLSEFSATVLSCKGKKAVLDKTAFFPEGGGQTADTGYIDGVRVLDVQIKDGVIYHYLEKDIEIVHHCHFACSFNTLGSYNLHISLTCSKSFNVSVLIHADYIL